MKTTENKVYFSYILFGSLYFIIKLPCFIIGFVCLRGLIYGLIATVLAVSIGILAVREYKAAKRTIAHWGAALIPLIVLSFSHILLIKRLYEEGTDNFPTAKLIIFMIFEAIAIAQIILAISMFRGLIYKRGRVDSRKF